VLSKNFNPKISVLQYLGHHNILDKMEFNTTWHVPQTWVNSGIYVYIGEGGFLIPCLSPQYLEMDIE
jgi:hypothetical protein